MDVLHSIFLTGLIPVITLDDVADAVPVAHALARGGVLCAEITFRTPIAADAIAAIVHECPEFLVGAGTVLDVETAEKAVEAGAQFIVSPGFSAAVVDYCHSRNVVVIPGVSTATEIQQAVTAGCSTVKFFPAEQAGGGNMINSLAAAFPTVSFVPTGGVNGKNVGSYLSCPCVTAVGGSWMVLPELIFAHNWAEITRRTEEAVMLLHNFTFAHVGINSADEDECRETAQLWSAFGFTQRETNVAIFTDPPFEVMKYPARGTKGHIAIKCRSIERAVVYLAQFGFVAKEDTARRDARGITFIYLDKEIGGFAVHLLRS